MGAVWARLWLNCSLLLAGELCVHWSCGYFFVRCLFASFSVLLFFLTGLSLFLNGLLAFFLHSECKAFVGYM